jgi:hypothetical protein
MEFHFSRNNSVIFITTTQCNEADLSYLQFPLIYLQNQWVKAADKTEANNYHSCRTNSKQLREERSFMSLSIYSEASRNYTFIITTYSNQSLCTFPNSIYSDFVKFSRHNLKVSRRPHICMKNFSYETCTNVYGLIHRKCVPNTCQ